MKRLLILFVVIVTVLSLLALPIAADEASDADTPKETTSAGDKETNEVNNKENDKTATLTDIFNSISDIAKYFKNPLHLLKLIEIDISSFKDGAIFGTLKSGGFNYFNGKDNPINLTISTLYNVTYPIGIITMVLAWIFGVAKSSTNTALDIKDKNSLIRSMLGLGIGLAVMTAAPYVLTVLTSISNWLCVKISSISISSYLDIYNTAAFNATMKEDIFNLYDFIEDFFIKGVDNSALPSIGTSKYLSIGLQFIYGIILVVVVEFVFCLNMLWLALLQVVSPIFIGLCANGMARKFTFNFIKEYFKALLMPVLSLIYTALSIAMLGTDNISNLVLIGTGATVGGAGVAGGAMTFEEGTAVVIIGGIVLLFAVIFPLVLAISTLGIAGKKLDKLIN